MRRAARPHKVYKNTAPGENARQEPAEADQERVNAVNEPPEYAELF